MTEPHGASGWVAVTPTTPEITMTNLDFVFCFRARLRLPQVTEGYPCTYATNSNGRACGEPRDAGAWRAHDCASVPLNERHNGVGEDIKGMAREATLRANSEQRAFELPVYEPEEGEVKPSQRPA